MPIGREVPLGSYETLTKLLVDQDATRRRLVFSLQLDGSYDVSLPPTKPAKFDMAEAGSPRPYAFFERGDALREKLIELFRDDLIPKFETG